MPNRYVCSVLEEMRKLNETRNYSSLVGLIEEVQTLVNRMEASIYDVNDYERIKKENDKLKRERTSLEHDKKVLEDEIADLELIKKQLDYETSRKSKNDTGK